MSRAGRKRKHGHRHANGRLIRDAMVTGTPEIALRRRLLAGRGGDVTSTSCPLDLMLLHKIIDGDTARACSWFSYTSQAVLGPPLQKNILNVAPPPEPISDAKLHRLTNEYLAAIAALNRAERDLLIDLLHFAQTPFWLLADIAGREQRPRNAALRAATLRALGKLQRQWDVYTRATRSTRSVAPAIAMVVAAE